MELDVDILKMHKDAKMPTYGSHGAGCFDLYAVEDAILKPGTFYSARTGLAFEIPDGYVMRVYSRSGLAFKYNVILVNGVGVIDSDYRGEVLLGLFNIGNKPVAIRKGDRIGQGEIAEVIKASFEFANELSETTRGSNGFGSTGK